MTSIMVSDSQLRQLTLPLLTSEDAELFGDDLPVLTDCFSRAALSVFTEPGDRFAGALVEVIGADKLLALVVNRSDAATLVGLLGETNEAQVDLIQQSFQNTLQELWQSALDRWRPRVSFSALQLAMSNFRQLGGFLICPTSQFFMQNIDVLGWSKPHLIWLRGKAEVLTYERSVAIVGSRTATNYGAQVCAELVSVAAEHNITTISGGAYGIDSLVHQASIQTQCPTIAVMAGGLDSFYPRGNNELFADMLQSNAIVAEVAPGVAPAKWRFLQRNRLIAAMSDATVVVEAGARSGSINTANTAIELERPVAVVPGSILWSTSVGCHRLLKEHPGEVQVLARAEDLTAVVLGEFADFELLPSLGALETRALDAFGKRALGFLDVQRIAGLTTNETQFALGRLELAGYLQRHPAGFVRVGNTL